MTDAIRTLIADDSETFQTLMRAVLTPSAGFQIVAQARDGAEAVALAARHRPALIVMDIRMPRMDGFEATRRIMRDVPAPVVIVTASGGPAVQASLDAVAAGALTFLAKPKGPAFPDWERERDRFVRTLRLMAVVKVVRRWEVEPARPSLTAPPPRAMGTSPIEIAAIVSSTGGPGALRQIVGALPRGFSLPLLVVQHITEGFVDGLVEWLDRNSVVRVKTAAHGEHIEPGTVYVAPTDAHLGATQDMRIVLSDAEPIGGFRPSGTYLLRSVAQSFGTRALGIVLTGMGRDGVDGAGDLHAAGGRVLAQDEASSVVYGMPQAAVQAGVCDAVLSLSEIAGALVQYSEP